MLLPCLPWARPRSISSRRGFGRETLWERGAPQQGIGLQRLIDLEVQLDGGGKRKNKIWTDFRPERNIRPQFQGKGATPWLLARRSGLASGIYNRLPADTRVIEPVDFE